MPVATLTSKGQLTLPKQVREEMNLTAGSQVDFVRDSPGEYHLERLSRPVSRLAGVLQYAGPPKSLEEMDEGIAQAAAASMQ